MRSGSAHRRANAFVTGILVPHTARPLAAPNIGSVAVRNFRSLAAAILIGGSFAGTAAAQGESFRFFLDTHGVADNAARPANSPLDFTNPTVTGAGRFYVYLAYGTNNQHIYNTPIRFEIIGDATFTGGSYYDHAVIGGAMSRWNPPPGNASPTPGSQLWAPIWQAQSANYGARNNDSTGGNGPDVPGTTGPTQQADSHFRADDGSAFGTTLLGHFDVLHGSSTTQATVWISTGPEITEGVTISPTDFVYFGFGDAGTTNGPNRRSANPDGYLNPVPEPATLALLGLAAFAAMRRPRQRATARSRSFLSGSGMKSHAIVGVWAVIAIGGFATNRSLAQDEGFRFFLDTHGVAEGASRPANTALDFTNPVVAGAGRFYIYLTYGTNNQRFYHTSLRFDITGPATFTDGSFYNKAPLAGMSRWSPPPSNTSPVPGSQSWVLGWVKEAWGYGTRNNDSGNGGPDIPGAYDTTEATDSHFRQGDDGSPFGTTLLGYFDVAHGPGADSAAIHIGSGASGSDGVTITESDYVYFGFGDAGTTNKGNRTSALPDGYVEPIPEPVTMQILVAALAMHGMRARRRNTK